MENPSTTVAMASGRLMTTAVPGPGGALNRTARHAIAHHEWRRWPRPPKVRGPPFGRCSRRSPCLGRLSEEMAADEFHAWSPRLAGLRPSKNPPRSDGQRMQPDCEAKPRSRKLVTRPKTPAASGSSRTLPGATPRSRRTANQLVQGQNGNRERRAVRGHPSTVRLVASSPWNSVQIRSWHVPKNASGASEAPYRPRPEMGFPSPECGRSPATPRATQSPGSRRRPAAPVQAPRPSTARETAVKSPRDLRCAPRKAPAKTTCPQ